MEQFSEEQLRALSAWPGHSIEGMRSKVCVHGMTARKSYFDQKYPVVGVLKEYEGKKLREKDRLIQNIESL